MNLYDRLLAALSKLLGRKDVESQLLLRVLSDPSVETDELELALACAEAL